MCSLNQPWAWPTIEGCAPLNSHLSSSNLICFNCWVLNIFSWETWKTVLIILELSIIASVSLTRNRWEECPFRNQQKPQSFIQRRIRISSGYFSWNCAHKVQNQKLRFVKITLRNWVKVKYCTGNVKLLFETGAETCDWCYICTERLWKSVLLIAQISLC